MVSSLAYWVCSVLSISVPEAFVHVPARCLLAAGCALVCVCSVGPWFIATLKQLKVGQPIREDEGFLLGELHKKKKNTPTMGGALLVASVVVATAFFADWSSFFVPVLVGALLFFGAIGAVDDWEKLQNRSSKGLSGKVRLVLQTLWALFVIALLFFPEFIQWFGYPVPHLIQNGHSVEWTVWQADMVIPFIAKPLFVASGALWLIMWALQWLTIVGAANAVNLTDGLDGLAAGCTIPVALALSLAALFCGNEGLAISHGFVLVPTAAEIAVCLSALAGACLGFLWFNSFPAQVFMGDTGSLAIGGMLGTAAVLLKREWFLALVGAIFVVETLSVMVQVVAFKRSGQRVFLCAPLHHHFEYRGLHEAKVVVRFWTVGLLLAVVGFLSLQVR
jgi:phospho-N-acetylmuramoyl-pentapeptide-transferase